MTLPSHGIILTSQSWSDRASIRPPGVWEGLGGCPLGESGSRREGCVSPGADVDRVTLRGWAPWGLRNIPASKHTYRPFIRQQWSPYRVRGAGANGEQDSTAPPSWTG